MKILSVLVFFALGSIAGLHIYWGFGGLWPGADLQSLIDTVVGDPRMTQMPSKSVTLAVAGLIFASGLFALAGRVPASWLVRGSIKTAIGVIAVIFVARGISGYALPEAIRSRMSEPFATYDQLYYSPLCLVLGAAFIVLFFAKPGTKRVSPS